MTKVADDTQADEVNLLYTIMNILDAWFPHDEQATLYGAASDIVSSLLSDNN